DSGFYNLIRSQISMKLATCFTEMNAKLALLMEYAKALGKSKDRMENDFYRLKREYSKMFHGLDAALENRVAQLDKPAMALAETRKKVILGKFTRDVPESLTLSEETESTEQKIISARLKSKTSRSLKFLGNKVHENLEYSALMDSLMEKKPVDKEYEEYIPVVYSSEQSMLMNDSYVMQLYYPEYLSESVKNNIGLNILGQIDSIKASQVSETEKQEIKKSFCDMASKTPMDQRVSRVMMELFERGGF
ncbi:MAG: hypothetical protein ACI4K7_02400, partial [Oscillospiraceae bacterium]